MAQHAAKARCCDAQRLLAAVLLTASLFSGALLGGCATRGNRDLLEARLRTQEDRIAQLRSELTQAHQARDVARAEAEQLRTAASSAGERGLLPEQSTALASLQGIRLGELLTGGLDQDGLPGDDALAMLLVPHDSDGELIKIPGSLEIELLDLTQSDSQRLVGQWSFSADQSAEFWHRGFVGHGYRLVLPWQSVPASDELVVHAKFTTIDGRTFDTTATVTIVPPSMPGPPPALAAGADGHQSDIVHASATELGDEWQSDRRPVESRDTTGSNPFLESSGQNPFASDGPIGNESPVTTSDTWTEQSLPRLR